MILVIATVCIALAVALVVEMTVVHRVLREREGSDTISGSPRALTEYVDLMSKLKSS